MDMGGNTVLAEGQSLFKSFASAIKAAPALTAGGVLLAFRPQFQAYSGRVDSYLAQQPAISGAIAGQLQSARTLSNDGADQSPKHWASYLNRVEVYLQTGSPTGLAKSAIGGKTLWILLAVVILFVVMGRGK